MTKFNNFAEIILDVPIDKTLDYGIPEQFENLIKKGMKVQVPLRGKIHIGYVLDIKKSCEHKNVSPIKDVFTDSALLPKDLLDLALWIAIYYSSPITKALKTILPPGIRKDISVKKQVLITRGKSKKEIIKYLVEIRSKNRAQTDVLDVILKVKKGIFLSELIEKAHTTQSPVNTLVKKGFLAKEKISTDLNYLSDVQYFLTKPKPLNSDQKNAFTKICKSLEANIFETHLLHGVTGSGKTEVYMQAIDLALKQKKGVIILVPEVALTTQTIERFQARFQEKIALLHYRLSDGVRHREWLKILKGEAKIVIGPRSAIFAPVPNLGLIIVDEEHEQSYKRENEMPCYHARDVAVMRGKFTNSTVVLGSATPCIESYYNAQNGKYTLSTLKLRPESQNTLEIKILDMRKELIKGSSVFSDELIIGIKERFLKGEQCILFLNRRGFHTSLFCKRCQSALKCKHCDIALTEHLRERMLSCHLCGYFISPPPTKCPICHSDNPVKYRGVGTELLEKALKAILPDVRICRLDADTTKHVGQHQKLLKSFATGKADVLIGTQMVAKGLHFPEVTLVGVINADTGLNIPDFRASESTFQLITQVAGRAGRSSLPGSVIIKTYMPENSSIQKAAKQDYESFYKEEIEVREMFSFPPFSSMVKIIFTGRDQNKTKLAANNYHLQFIKSLTKDFTIHPIQTAGYAKVKDKFRFQFLIRGLNISPITKAFEDIKRRVKTPWTIRVSCDVNPLSTYF